MMTNENLSSDEKTFLKTLYWWGIATMFGCPHNEDVSQCEIGLVGVPHSSGNGATERDQHLGPRAIRNVKYRKYKAYLMEKERG